MVYPLAHSGTPPPLHLLQAEGLFVGGSAALNCVGAVRAARQLGPGHTIVTVLCDGGHRYLSTIHAPDAEADDAPIRPLGSACDDGDGVKPETPRM